MHRREPRLPPGQHSPGVNISEKIPPRNAVAYVANTRGLPWIIALLMERSFLEFSLKLWVSYVPSTG
jgi:hypothetical protein